MSRVTSIFLVLLISYQVNSEASTIKPCDRNVPDGPRCADDPDSCKIPEKSSLCQRYCRICVDEGSTLPTTVAATAAAELVDSSKLLCAARNKACNDTNVRRLCPKTCADYAKLTKGPATTPMISTIPSTTPVITTPSTKLTQPTTPQPTTPQPNTPQPTTPQPTTPQLTTPQPTTSQPTTPQPTTPQPTTSQPTTPQPTTLPPTTPPPPTALPTTKPTVMPTTIPTTTAGAHTTTLPTEASTTTKAAVTKSKDTTAAITSTTEPAVTKKVAASTSVPDTPDISTKETKPTTLKPMLRNAVKIEAFNETALKIRMTIVGYIPDEPINKICSEIENTLKDKHDFEKVVKVDVEDGVNSRGDRITVLTVHARLKAGLPPASDILDELNEDDTFRAGLSKHLRDQDIESFSELYDTDDVSLNPTQPQSSKKTATLWAENNWYVIFGICIAVVLLIGLGMLAATSSSSRKRQKLNLQDKKLAFTKV